MQSISVLSGMGATIGALPKVTRVDLGEDWRIPRTMDLEAAWKGDHADKFTPQSETAGPGQASIFDFCILTPETTSSPKGRLAHPPED
jgi:hypothetical protein